MKEHIQFDYIADNYFTELKEIEIRNERMNEVNQIDPYVGKYFSIDYVRRQVLKQTDIEIKEIDKQIEQVMADCLIADPAMDLEMMQGGDPAAGGAPAGPDGNLAPDTSSVVTPADQRKGEF